MRYWEEKYQQKIWCQLNKNKWLVYKSNNAQKHQISAEYVIEMKKSVLHNITFILNVFSENWIIIIWMCSFFKIKWFNKNASFLKKPRCVCM